MCQEILCYGKHPLQTSSSESRGVGGDMQLQSAYVNLVFQAIQEADKAVQNVKSLSHKPQDQLLPILASGAKCRFSPAKLLMSHKLRITVPMMREQRKQKIVELALFKKRDHNLKERQRDKSQWLTLYQGVATT